MPKKQGLHKGDQTRLARLPQRDDLTILGGKRRLGLYLREGKETFQPHIAIWLEEQSGMVRASEIINPLEHQDEGVGAALAALAQALIQPPPTPLFGAKFGAPERGARKSRVFQPGLPAAIIINDEALAQAAREVFAPLHVSVDYQQDVPAFDAAFQSLSEQLGASEDAQPPEPFSWDMPFALLSPLYAAAAGFWRREPWSYMPDHPPLVIELGDQGPQPHIQTIYASILGGLGLATGIAFYYSLEAYERFWQRSLEMQTNNPAIDQAIEMLRQSGAPVDEMPPDELRLMLGQLLGGGPQEGQDMWDIIEEGLVCFFNPKDECDPTYLEWMAEHGLKPPSREGVPTFLKTLPGQEPREPQDEREIKAMTLALEALNQFFSHFRSTLEAGPTPNETLTHQARVTGGAAVSVSFTPTEESYQGWLDEEPKEPDTP